MQFINYDPYRTLLLLLTCTMAEDTVEDSTFYFQFIIVKVWFKLNTVS
jgi:hypothetical protein